MNRKAKIIASGLTVMLFAMPVGAFATDSLTYNTSLRDNPVERTVAYDESIDSLLDCGSSDDDGQSQDGQNETTETPENESGEEEGGDSSEEEECDPLEETKEELKDDLDDIPRIAYCKRINGRFTCVGINDSDICALYVQYEYRFCYGLWKDL